MENWIELQSHVEDYQGMELWMARAHYDGRAHDGYALAGPDDADWYESDPREDDLTDGLRLPAYMPGHKPPTVDPERHEEFYRIIKGRWKKYYQYAYRTESGDLFRCIKPTLAACRTARDQWLAAR